MIATFAQQRGGICTARARLPAGVEKSKVPLEDGERTGKSIHLGEQ